MENERQSNSKSKRKPKETDNPDNVDDKTSILSIVCRICFDDSKDEAIITPCHCKGTVAFVHRSCLEKWLAESNTTSCELCQQVYETERVPKYSAKESIWQWIRHQPRNLGFRVRRIRCDLIACAVLTPLAIVITYICLFSADYYNQQKYSNVPTARWTSISLLVMIAIMLFGYYVWVYIVVGYHGRMWYYWWQRECVVRYIPPRRRSVQVETALDIAPIENTVSIDHTLELGPEPSDETIADESLEEVREEISIRVQGKSSDVTISSIVVEAAPSSSSDADINETRPNHIPP